MAREMTPQERAAVQYTMNAAELIVRNLEAKKQFQGPIEPEE